MRRMLPFLGALTLLAASCGPGEVKVTSADPEPTDFFLQVADGQGDAGAGMSMDGDDAGNPHLSYLVFDPPPEPGEPPAGIQIGVPLRPTVMHAHLTGGAWTRSPLSEEAKIEAEDETAIAIDADGVHHVAWTQGEELFYASNADGAFSEPMRIFNGSVRGLSMAASEAGDPFIAFYEELSSSEGPAALISVVYLPGGEWVLETAAEAEPPGDTATTGIGVSGSAVFVAYGDGDHTLLARGDDDDGTPWSSEIADVEGGHGVSLTLDGDGNPHLAYYTRRGEVRHAHSVSGGPWEITPEVALAGDAPGAGWSTSIDLDEDGVHHIAYKVDDGIGYRSNADGDFAGQEWLNIEPAVNPEVVAGPEGIVHVAWYDTVGRILTLASRSPELPLLAVPPPEEEPAPAPQPTLDPDDLPCEPEGSEITVVAPPSAVTEGFDTDCLAAPAGEPIAIVFENEDPAIPHNVSVYPSEAEGQTFSGVLLGPGSAAETITGPDSTTYEGGPLDEGLFWFQCDVHPTMNGAFVVA